MTRLTDAIRLLHCPDCRHAPLGRRRIIIRWREGLGRKREYAAKVDAVACPACGCEVIDEYARRQKHEVWCRANGLLGPSEIGAIRGRLGLSIEAFAALLGLGAASVGRWERGAIVQNVANDRLLRLVERSDNAEVLARLAGVTMARAKGGTRRNVRKRG